MTEMPTWIFISLWIIWVLFGLIFIVVIRNAVTQYKKNLANMRVDLLLGKEVSFPPLRLTPAGYKCFFGFPIVTVFWISWNIFG